MKNTLALPMSRVAALINETQTSPEAAVAKLLSVLHAREMWAHLDERKSTKDVAVFVYGRNVPTPKRGKTAATQRKGVGA